MTIAQSTADIGAPIFYHDGCSVCLDLGATLQLAMPNLQLVDLGLDADKRGDAAMLGIDSLPCLAIGGKLLPVSPHSTLEGLDEGH